MRRRTATTSAAALAVILGLLLGAVPAAAAPPPVTHSVVVSTNPLDTTPHVLDGQTETVIDLGDRVLVGGTFTQVKRWSKPEVFSRTNLFAYTKATGAIDPLFAPQPSARVTAMALAPDGKVFVAGLFRDLGGVAGRNFLAKVDPMTGAVDPTFAPAITGAVYDLQIANGRLYVGGTFTKVRNLARTNFAALDLVTGKADTTVMAFTGAVKGTTRIMRFDISPDGTKLVAIGNFTNVGGLTRHNVAVLDLGAGSAAVSGWVTDMYRQSQCHSSYDTFVFDVDIAPTGGWFVIVTTGGPQGSLKLCDSAARWELAPTGPTTTTWRNYTGGDTLTSVAITGAAVYVAGHQKYSDNPNGVNSPMPGSLVRPGIAALDPASGEGLTWNPTRHRGLQAPRLVPTPEGLYVLNDSGYIGGEYHPRFSFLPVVGGTPPVIAP